MKHFNQFHHYESEFSVFMDELKAKNPAIEEDQKRGFLIWWDKPPLELEEMERDKISEVKLKAYTYD